MSYQPVTLFVYAYWPQNPSDMEDGGFTINLHQDGTLLFNSYDVDGNILLKHTFPLGTAPVERYMQMVNQSRSWLRYVPGVIGDYQTPLESEHTFGFHGLPLFRIDNLPSIVANRYRNPAAHYAIRVHRLMQEICQLLAYHGIYLSLDSFRWDSQQINPYSNSAMYENLA